MISSPLEIARYTTCTKRIPFYFSAILITPRYPCTETKTKKKHVTRVKFRFVLKQNRGSNLVQYTDSLDI